MKINRRSLYICRSTWSLPGHIKAVIMFLAVMVPFVAVGVEERPVPYEQKFVITAYYSPEPGQCCYVKGGLQADRILNGEGKTTADGTPVAPGVIAAPATYAFGTRIDIPGMGVFTVRDRGGAINELADGTHRLDIWVGYGEEGLARALAFGVKTVTATVYPLQTEQPNEAVELSVFPAPVEKLSAFLVSGGNLMAMRAKEGQTGYTVQVLRDSLREIGYFSSTSTGFYGPETQAALAQFLADQGIKEDASQLTELTAAHILGAVKRKSAVSPVSGHVNSSSHAKVVIESKRLLRFLGYYKGRTDGQYNDDLYAAILRFQQANNLAGDSSSPGAGQIGPKTMQKLAAVWNKKRVNQEADKLLDINRIDKELVKQGKLTDRFLELGNQGPQVTLLQTVLSEQGFFEEKDINGVYGELTKSAVIAYQKAKDIIASDQANGAGEVGPFTLRSLQRDERSKYYWLVRAQGWQAL